MLPSNLPLTRVRPTIGPREHALTMLFAVEELTLVSPSICPLHRAPWTHVVPLPLASVGAAIAPLIRALTIHVVGAEISLVAAAGVPRELPTPVLVSFVELPNEDGSVSKALHSMAFLHLHTPLAFVGGTVAVGVLAHAMLPVGIELSLVFEPSEKISLPSPCFSSPRHWPSYIAPPSRPWLAGAEASSGAPPPPAAFSARVEATGGGAALESLASTWTVW
eukprot:CAMPEP_0115263898 /NCGR_PEP_ID=MMETSP0270-20121206/50148_1 /TAXON_ID=71861 /ORGANISM="Scrippsiella trochoidea, Strain CCMP3099" /LENGTH=220 /DNA_ID=CAMNT_0002679895 /DNA_START=357 /DNA_END=1020 /DNA_ORIENTATION=-